MHIPKFTTSPLFTTDLSVNRQAPTTAPDAKTTGAVGLRSASSNSVGLGALQVENQIAPRFNSLSLTTGMR